VNEWVREIDNLKIKLQHQQALLDKAVSIFSSLWPDQCPMHIDQGGYEIPDSVCEESICDDCWIRYLEWAVEKDKEIKEEQMSEDTMVEIDLNKIWIKWDKSAKLCLINYYIADALEQAREGNVAALTGAAPVWMYLKIAHALHGKVTQLWYTSPATGLVLIFNHDPK
jgi:hypothetical protein